MSLIVRLASLSCTDDPHDKERRQDTMLSQDIKDRNITSKPKPEKRAILTEAGERRKLRRFAREYANTRLKIALFLLWSKYPDFKFTVGTIASALCCSTRMGIRAELNRALECFRSPS